MEGLTAKAEITINAPREKIWHALTTPEEIKEYMFGSRVESGWREGDAISWRGEWQGKPYEDKGKVLVAKKFSRLVYSHQSGGQGESHTVSIEITDAGNGATRVKLEQDNNKTEEARNHSQKNWEMMLESLKKHLESQPNSTTSGN